ncbi:unnamed protein product, partial [Didymodactylos carnosus]
MHTMTEQQKQFPPTAQHSYGYVLDQVNSSTNTNTVISTNRKRPSSASNEISTEAKTKRKKHNRQFSEVRSMTDVRKYTFSHWALKQPSKTHMIASGFFGCNVGDRVICIYCNLICQQWILTDDPSEVHRVLSPDCCFVQSYIVSSTAITPLVLNETSNVFNSTEIVSTQACNQMFAEVPKRHASFAKWPKDESVPPVDHMVKAGFFYVGTRTIVSCFYCNGSLQNWTATDNPIIEHARWFPHCAYIKQLCDDELFQKIQLSKRAQKQLESPSNGQVPISDENRLSHR